jgi:ribosomal protein S18 acetylase RimI-like enzyme
MSSPAPPPFTLRAVNQADYRWLWELKRLTMLPYVEQTWGGWDDIAQERFFRQNFTPTTIQIVVANGEDAGLLNVEREPHELFLANIQIHPAFQGNGLGSAVVRTVLESAAALQLSVRLQVLKVNTRARDLYLRLGFTIYQETLTHFLMRHAATPARSET